VALRFFCFYPVFNAPEGDSESGMFRLHQVDIFSVVKVELVMHYYNSSERRYINHGTR
jgi:hypothetical protein